MENYIRLLRHLFSYANQYYHELRRGRGIKRDRISWLTPEVVGPPFVFVEMDISAKIWAWLESMSEVPSRSIEGRIVTVICQKQNSTGVPLGSNSG